MHINDLNNTKFFFKKFKLFLLEGVAIITMNINYRTIFKILILFITFFIFTNGDDSENSTGGGPVYVYFKGVVHGAGEHELVLDLFCDHQKFDFYTGANGKFNVQIDEQIVSHLSCCAQWITIGFYKKDTKASQPSCWGFKSSKKVLKCYAIVNVDWLKFGETTFTQETRDQQVDASAETENEFRVVFGRGGYAAVNGKVVGCEANSTFRNRKLFRDYFEHLD